MYSFGPLPRQKRSGRIIGTHQKVDRIARRHLEKHLNDSLQFPAINEILHFEGSRGPDGIKLKSPGVDEPSHFIDPYDPNDKDLTTQIDDHILNLAKALVATDTKRASFEAAWLAHAVADGLTPAHHEPYKEQMEANGKNASSNTQVSGKIFMSGKGSKKDFISNNWKHWGAKGVLTSHTLFEAGMATTAKPLRFSKAQIIDEEIEELKSSGYESIYRKYLAQIAKLKMYDEFIKKGWTHSLAVETKETVLPLTVKAIMLAWYAAYETASNGGVK